VVVPLVAGAGVDGLISFFFLLPCLFIDVSMASFSIVIVVKNGAATLPRLLNSIRGLSTDVVVVDTGSTDATMELARQYTNRVCSAPWEGYGLTKQKAALLANNDWVLSLDADEEVTAELYASLQSWKPGPVTTVYQLHWLNHIGQQPIRYGLWRNDWKNRLFQKHTVNWNDANVHEDLVSTGAVQYQRLQGYLRHYSFTDLHNAQQKHVHLAQLMGQLYAQKGKKAGLLKMLLAPVWVFVKGYVLKLGFLDGVTGLHIARITAAYTYQKYAVLRRLNGQ
jgi:glycosyltransferase involved in cell wall biosynthesis